MFKAIKEFFIGKPKVEETIQPQPAPVIETSIIFEPVQVTVPVKVEAPAPVVEAVKEPEVFIDKTITDTITITAKSDIIPSTISTLDAWPFTAPATVTVAPVEKKRTTTKKPPVVDKKPGPAIKAGNSKSRKKK